MASPKKSKRILLGVTGGIAAYKACELVRLLVKADYEVRVVMTTNAEEFVSALTFQSLSNQPVLRSLHGAGYDMSATAHIDLANWADLFVVAPATANFLAKARAGIADDALLTELLAFQGTVLVAPAMNTRMWDAAITQENLKALGSRGYHFIGPVSGDLACREIGAGKMSEPEEIFAKVESLLSSSDKPLVGKTVLITSGPTRNYIDSIRFLTNRSSGRMGHAMAMAARDLGAKVVLVTGPVDSVNSTVPGAEVIKVETGEEMLAASLKVLPKADFVVAAAAVADFAPSEVLPGKIRREGILELKLRASTDVLASLGKQKSSKQIFIGFAAEAGAGEAEMQKAREKLERKNLDLLAFNNVSRSDIGFDVAENEVILFSRLHEPELLPKANKDSIARSILLRALALQAEQQ